MSFKQLHLCAAALFLAIALCASKAHALEATAVIQGDEDGGDNQPPHLRPFRRASGPLHLRRHLGRRRFVRFPTCAAFAKTSSTRCKNLNIPNLRWPGGCYADDYHWRDGIGPRDKRPHRVNIHWGQVIDTNAFGTHEFLDLCEQIGAEPYIAGNVGQRHAAGAARLDRVHDVRRRQRAGQPPPQERPREAVEESAMSASATRTGAAAATWGRSTTPICSAATPRSAATSATTGWCASPAAPAASTAITPAS